VKCLADLLNQLAWVPEIFLHWIPSCEDVAVKQINLVDLSKIKMLTFSDFWTNVKGKDVINLIQILKDRILDYSQFHQLFIKDSEEICSAKPSQFASFLHLLRLCFRQEYPIDSLFRITKTCKGFWT